MNPSTLIRMIGRPSPPHVVLVDEQDTSDIMRGLVFKHKQCTADYDKIAGEFSGGSILEICQRLFNFCKKNFRYHEEDVDSQYLSAPQTMLARGYSDCKGYALFIGGVLDALKRSGQAVDWFYRFASYELFQQRPGHVFVVVDSPAGEIWVDPVLDQFNYHLPYWSAMDRHVNTAGETVGCACNEKTAIGSTAAETGTTIMKLAPVLAYIPVVGWIATAAAEIIGGIISIVGSHWAQSDDVRWLVQLFEYYALNNKGATNDHQVNEGNTANAQAFFSVVLGVPIGGRKDFNILQSGDGNTNKPTRQDATQRATNYLIWKNLVGKISLSQAVEAATIAAGLNPASFPVGGWAGLVPAPSTIDKTGSAVVNNSGAAAVMPAGYANDNPGISPLLIVAAAAAAFLIIK